MDDKPVARMKESAFGNSFLLGHLKKVRASIEKEGQLTKAAVKSVIWKGQPFGLTDDLEKFRLELEQNPDGLGKAALRAKQKEKALAFIERKIQSVMRNLSDCEEKEELEEEARQAAAVLPSAKKLDKILRYESALQKKLNGAMSHLERLQRRRLGEHLPAPLAMEISHAA